MSLKDEEADDHGREGLLQLGMTAGEEVFKGDEVIVALAHLLALNGNHVVVHPGVHGGFALCCHALGNLTFMMREDEVEATAVNVKLGAEVLLPHCGTFQMPSGETVAPGRRPTHDVFGSRLFPQGEIEGEALLVLPVEGAGGRLQIFYVAARKHSVAMVGIILAHIEVYRAVRLVSIAGVKNLLHILNLLYYMTRSMRLYAGRKHVEGLHVVVIAVEVILHHFHGLKLLKACFFGYLVFAAVGVMLQMTYVGDVAHIAHLISQMGEVAIQYVERNGRTCMT